MDKIGVAPYQGCSCMSVRVVAKLDALDRPQNSGKRLAVFMSICCCADKKSNWRIRFDAIRNLDQATGVDLIYNFNGVQVGVVDSGSCGRFLPWSDRDRFHEIFRCGDDGSYPDEDWSVALTLKAAVDRENEKAELERSTAAGQAGESGNPRL